MNEKEADAIAQIAMYCEKIKRAQEKFFPTKDLFDEEALYRDGCAFLCAANWRTRKRLIRGIYCRAC